MDKNYWEEFYKTQNEELKPSLFAKTILSTTINPGYSIIELGCGNGRDAIFFANEGLKVVAVDQCESEIEFLNTRYKQLENLSFLAADFTTLSNFEEAFDIVYSRFTLHSVSKQEEQRTLRWAYSNLKEAGSLCIEVRGQKNEIYKMGDKVVDEEGAYIYNNHYRRFLNFDKFCEELRVIGFKLSFAAEARGFAPFAGQDEMFIRIIARK